MKNNNPKYYPESSNKTKINGIKQKVQIKQNYSVNKCNAMKKKKFKNTSIDTCSINST